MDRTPGALPDRPLPSPDSLLTFAASVAAARLRRRRCAHVRPPARAAGLQLLRAPGLLAAGTPSACAVPALPPPRLLCKTASLVSKMSTEDQ